MVLALFNVFIIKKNLYGLKSRKMRFFPFYTWPSAYWILLFQSPSNPSCNFPNNFNFIATNEEKSQRIFVLVDALFRIKKRFFAVWSALLWNWTDVENSAT